MRLWIRGGDADDYHEFGFDFDAAAEYLQLIGVSGRLCRCGRYGVSARGFTGHNYISLYWGDDDAQPERGLTDKEVAKLSTYLRRERATG